MIELIFVAFIVGKPVRTVTYPKLFAHNETCVAALDRVLSRPVRSKRVRVVAECRVREARTA